MAHVPHTASIEECIEHCTECHNVCVAHATHLLQVDDGLYSPTVVLLLDCAQICRTSADFMLRSSPLHHLTCGICADICEECAQACDGLDTPEASHCADVCRRCGASCREMSVAGTAGAAGD